MAIMSDWRLLRWGGRSRGRIKQATIDPPDECYPVKSRLLILADGLRLDEFQLRKHGMLMGEIRWPINKIRTYARGARNRVFLEKSFVRTRRLSKKPGFFLRSASRTENIRCFLIWGYLESFRID